MSNTNGKSSLDRIRYFAEKFSSELEKEDIHIHGAVVQAMNNFIQFRAVELKVKENADEAAVKLEADRQVKFGLNPPTPISR